MRELLTVSDAVTTIPIRSFRVEVIQGPDKGASMTSSSDRITIGTAEGNDIVLSDPMVSRYHLELERCERGLLVRDNGSTNGTLIGAMYVQLATVPPGTVLQLGKSKVKIDDAETVNIELYRSDRLGMVIGGSPEMRRLMAQIERAANSDASVLLVGETGTGKEVIARAIHDASPRASGPFETVDCGAQLQTLIASELFGHERGAFTGADQQHIGAFERANRGTLFLDEIGELPIGLQPSLLGAVERRGFKRVGGAEQISVDVRFIAATHRDLRADVNAGTFRRDLYYRLGVVVLRVPPLRERASDIPLLVEHFLREAGHQGPVEDIIPRATMEGLLAHHWPGNVRELRNLVEAALVMGEAQIPVDDERAPVQSGPNISLESLAHLPYGDARDRLLREFESYYLKKLLEANDGNVSKAARQAKMNRGYLQGMLKKLGIRASDDSLS